jgi:hypothetical protein
VVITQFVIKVNTTTGLQFPAEAIMRFFLWSTPSRVAGALTPRVKRPGSEVDHSPPCSAKVKNTWSYTSTSQYVFVTWCLLKHRDNFSLTFTFTAPIITTTTTTTTIIIIIKPAILGTCHIVRKFMSQ